MDLGSNIYVYSYTGLLLHHNTEIELLKTSQNLFLSTPRSVMCIAYYVVWKKQKAMMENQNHIVREKKISKNAIHYHCSFSFDLAAISNIVTVGIFWCNPTLL